MLDELPFEADDAAPPRRHRRQEGGKSALTLVLVLVLLGTLGIAGWFGFDKVKGFFTAEDFEGDGNGQKVQVTVQEGELPADIGESLYDAGVVASAQAFVDAAEENPDAVGIQPGTYTLEKKMSAASALTLILDPASKGTPELNVPDGQPVWATYETLAVSTGVPVEEFEAAGEDPEALGVPAEWFERNDDQKVVKSIEGFLLPDKYTFEPGSSAKDMLSEMVSRFLAYTDDIDFVDKVKDLGYDMAPYEALIVASLARGEAAQSKPDDLGKVARVVYNRIHNDFPCGNDLYNCLEFDSALNYGIQLAGGDYTDSADISQEQLDDESNKYNTNVYAGLTPTPINSPGKESLAGAVNPPEGNWTFFVATDKKGTTEFTDNNADFEVLQDKARENGVL
jgi:UPF0755 protein